MASHRNPLAIAGYGLCCCTFLAVTATAQATPSQATPSQAPVVQRTPPQPAAPASTAPDNLDDPTAAYSAGYYDKALQGFVDVQVEHPEDPAVQMNLGSAHYKMRDFEQAQTAFAAATLAAEPTLAAQAYYNLGNVAFRQGKLEEAVARYQRALELNPEDLDAKFNLEFTRDEIRRRLEETKKRQEEQQQQSGDKSEQGEQGEQGQEGQQGGDNAQPKSAGADQDQDGLSDETERNGANPTDPANPDTDGDGLSDGQEDADQDGQVDEGESDPNKADSDGDGIPDGQDPQPTDASQPAQDQEQQADADQPPPGQEGEAAEGQPQPGEMTPEEAARYLAALDEGRPVHPRRGDQKGRPTRPAKDW